ncbi:hypothetical protein FGO68_gene369 [Halteria grandinella]|uniref:Uncharacterized protein n=1 Tax=Halteria grandinella TaxID=5974 RepID=A0A8J8NTW7_HALGN|nr:hypothetical protein FGO68_gene369 [Halteria grandinella]
MDPKFYLTFENLSISYPNTEFTIRYQYQRYNQGCNKSISQLIRKIEGLNRYTRIFTGNRINNIMGREKVSREYHQIVDQKLNKY